MSRRDDWDDRGRDDYDDRRSSGPRSGAVTGAAVINFVAGGIILVLGICGLIGMLMAAGELGRGGGFGVPGIGGSFAISILVVLVHVGWGVGCIIAGVGLIGRKSSARVFALVLGGLAIPLGLLYLWTAIQGFGFPGAAGMALIFLMIGFLFIGHTIWNFVVLLNGSNARDFR